MSREDVGSDLSLTSKYVSMYSETMCSDLGLFWQYTMYMCSLRSCSQNIILDKGSQNLLIK